MLSDQVYECLIFIKQKWSGIVQLTLKYLQIVVCQYWTTDGDNDMYDDY